MASDTICTIILLILCISFIYLQVIQGSLLAGHLLPLRNNKTHCITDRFTLGGPMNVRGFEMAGIGPHSDGCSLGSEVK